MLDHLSTNFIDVEEVNSPVPIPPTQLTPEFLQVPLLRRD